ncbi:MAG: serine/threonine-protein kinase [Polyangia bacterium]
MAAAPPRGTVPQRIGSYRVVRVLGSGGMGAVYEAINDQISRHAAIKLLHARFAENPELATRFLNEARAVNIVQHPGLVQIYEFGQLDDGGPYIVMELLNGETLHSRMKKGAMLPETAMLIGRQIASVLAAAHAKKIIHRDLKPQNVMLIPDPDLAGGERVKVLDFGLAKIMEQTDGNTLTSTGMIMGTPTYMAPEQCRSARDVSDRSDVYALGVMLYEMISGQTPFKADSDAELMAAHMYKAPPRLRDKAPTVMPELGALVERMLAKKPTDRPTAAEAAGALAQLTGQRASAAVPILSTEGLPTGDVSAQGPTLMDPQKTKPPASPGAGSRLSRGQLTVILGLLGVLLLLGVALVLRDRLSKPPPPPPPVVLPSVTWSITSQPSGAEVIGGDNKVLGRTPLVLSRPKSPGTEALTLRAPGHKDLSVRMDTSGDVSTELKLEALPPEPTEDAATQKGKGGKKTSKKGTKGKRGKG